MYPEKQDSKNATSQVSLKSNDWTAGQMTLRVGELAQVVERPLSMREVPGSIPGFSNSAFHLLDSSFEKWRLCTAQVHFKCFFPIHLFHSLIFSRIEKKINAMWKYNKVICPIGSLPAKEKQKLYRSRWNPFLNRQVKCWCGKFKIAEERKVLT